MAQTKIDWADRVWNPVTGCTKISEGCVHCYAERMAKRLAGRCGYPKDEPFRVTWRQYKFYEPNLWKKPQRIFICSMGDFFHEDVPHWVQSEIYDVIKTHPEHTFMFLTKRPQNVMKWWMPYYENVWLGVTCENQARTDERISILLQIPAAKRFVSIEPMLGPVDLRPYLYDLSDRKYKDQYDHDGYREIKKRPDWVILGGETGPGARPMHPDWVRSVRNQCQAAGVPFFFKQWGEWAPGLPKMAPYSFVLPLKPTHEWCFNGVQKGNYSIKIGKKAAGHLLDGKEHREFPVG